MSVSNIVPIRRLPWGGGTGQGRPSGMWIGVATVIMDASGGIAEAQIQFQAASDPLQALMYHVGQMYVTISGGTAAANYQVKSNAMDWGPGSGGGFPWQHNFVVQSLGGVVGGSESPGIWRDSGKNILLGTPLAEVDPAVLEAIGVNTNGDTLTLTAMGYVWSQTALSEPGAPLLPEGSPWG